MRKPTRNQTIIIATILIAITALFIPIPVRAKIIEGNGPVPEPICRLIDFGLFNLSYHLDNLTLHLTIGQTLLEATCEHIDLQIYSKELESTSNVTYLQVCFNLHNVWLRYGDSEGYIQLVSLEVEAEVYDHLAYYYCYGTSWMPICHILYNTIINLS